MTGLPGPGRRPPGAAVPGPPGLASAQVIPVRPRRPPPRSRSHGAYTQHLYQETCITPDPRVAAATV